MNSYSVMIIKACGCAKAEVDEVEDIMRHSVFHSTLDWQTREALAAGAKLAYQVLKLSRKEKRNDKRR